MSAKGNGGFPFAAIYFGAQLCYINDRSATPHLSKTRKEMSVMSDNAPVVPTKKQNIVQALKFLVFSASAGVIQILSFTLLHELAKLPYWPCYLVALTLSVLYNFTVNRRFTFKSANNVPLAMLQIFIYYLIFTPLSTWWGDALTAAGWNEYLVLFGTMVINFVSEFCVCRFIVYRKSMYTNESGQRELDQLDKQEPQQRG